MRASGILLPIFSLPSKFGIGSFSKEAYNFIDFLTKSGQKYWQILPLGPTSYGDSPYQSFSTYAGNPYFIDLEEFISSGLLSYEECSQYNLESGTQIDYENLYNNRFKILRTVYERDLPENKEAFEEFKVSQQEWLKDYTLFMSLKNYFGGKSWIEWETDIRYREELALSRYSNLLEEEANFYAYLQYLFAKQWGRLKAYANDKGISIIGDIPIYVAFDSADVWANSELFQFDEERLPIAVAGCPPDGFSETGQLWGNPLYDWEYHKNSEFSWWIKRISYCYKLYDVLRIDHFRGFDEYYSIPYLESTAINGKWCKGPGLALFTAIKNSLGEKPIIAEDLGYLTDSVRQLVRDSSYPGMKVLEFAFDSRDSSGPSDYLPYNYTNNCVVYTGTHDNETLKGWLSNICEEDLSKVRKYLNMSSASLEELTTAMVRLAHSSVADLCIIPLQDYLLLGNEARINRPSSLGSNWLWRVCEGSLTIELAENIRDVSRIYGRG